MTKVSLQIYHRKNEELMTNTTLSIFFSKFKTKKYFMKKRKNKKLFFNFKRDVNTL